MNLETITLHDLMSEDYYVHLGRNKKFGYNMEVIRDETDASIKELGVHEYAIDSLAAFCRMYLNQYQRVCES